MEVKWPHRDICRSLFEKQERTGLCLCGGRGEVRTVAETLEQKCERAGRRIEEIRNKA